MRRRKFTLVDKSTINGAGWGLFAGTKLKKGEYIDEVCVSESTMSLDLLNGYIETQNFKVRRGGDT